MAVAILGWPIDKIPVNYAQEVIKGAQEICNKAGIPLAGGHSVDTQEPLFGLAVTGNIKKEHLKRNNTVQKNDLLYLTKPLGIGILSTALKRGLLMEEDYKIFVHETTSLNSIGEALGKLNYVNAMTDVTGFGFTGHLLEMLANTNFSAVIRKENIPILNAAKDFAKQFVFPDNTTRNYSAQTKFIDGMLDLDLIFYCDPQTSGGLLVSVSSQHEHEMDEVLNKNNQFFAKVGSIVAKQNKEIVFV